MKSPRWDSNSNGFLWCHSNCNFKQPVMNSPWLDSNYNVLKFGNNSFLFIISTNKWMRIDLIHWFIWLIMYWFSSYYQWMILMIFFCLNYQVIGSMDNHTAPCSNFWNFACHNWLVSNPMPPWASKWSSKEELSHRGTNSILMILKILKILSNPSNPKSTIYDTG